MLVNGKLGNGEKDEVERRRTMLLMEDRERKEGVWIEKGRER